MAANPQGAVTETQAAEAIDSILATDPDYADDGQPEEEPQEAEKEVEESEEPEQEAQPEEEVETLEIDPDEKVFDVEVTLPGGEKETRKMSLNELKAGQMMQADYSRKTEELSRQRKEVQNELRQGIEKERSQYLETLNTLQKGMMQLVVPEAGDLDKLAEEDPAEFIKVQNRLNKINQTWQSIEAEKQRIASEQQEYIRSQILPAELEKIQSAIPSWGQEVKQAIMQTGETYGFTPEELGAVIDSRMIKVLHDAHLYQKLQAEKPSVAKKVAEKPKVMKPGSGKKQSMESDHMKRLKKSGDWRDAGALLAERLNIGD